jgi:hypothetical protein
LATVGFNAHPNSSTKTHPRAFFLARATPKAAAPPQVARN